MIKGLIAGKFGVLVLIVVGILVYTRMQSVQAKKQ